MSKKIHVLFLTRSYHPNIGGVEKHIYEVSRRLVELGHNVTIIAEQQNTPDKANYHSKEKSAKNMEALQGIQIYRIPITVDERKKKYLIWRWLFTNRHLLKNTDIIHCHDVYYWFLPFKVLYPTKKVFTTFHGYESYPIKKRAIIYRKVFEFLSNKSFCVGHFMKKWYYARPTKFIYGGYTISKKLQRPMKNSAVFIGRLDEHTGIETYVKAVQLIRRQIPDFTLTVYGDGALKSEIQNEGIILKGFEKNAEEHIGKFEFAFVSRYLAIIEAMGANRLVFAIYDNPVKEDYLKMTPFSKWIHIINSPEELSKKILLLKKQPNIDDLKLKLSSNWAKEQTWKMITSEYLKLWNLKAVKL